MTLVLFIAYFLVALAVAIIATRTRFKSELDIDSSTEAMAFGMLWPLLIPISILSIPLIIGALY